MSNRRQKSLNADDEATEWLQLVLATVSAVALTVIYLLLPSNAEGNSLVSFAEASIPNIVTALLVFPVLYLVLGRVRLRAEDRIIRRVEQAVASTGTEGVVLKDVSGMAGMVHGIVSRMPKREVVRLEIIGFTGGTFTTDLLRDLLQGEGRKFELVLRVIDFSKAETDLMPSHWQREEAETFTRLPVLCRGRVKLDIWVYPTLPFMLGLLIGDSHLFVAFPPWDRLTGKLADRSLEYRYYERANSTEHIFDLFDNWAKQPRQVSQYSSSTEE